MTHRACVLVLVALAGSGIAVALPAPGPRLQLPEFNSLRTIAASSVVIALDAPLLAMAAGFLDSSDPDEADVKEVIKGLQGIYVRSYSFDHDVLAKPAELEAVRQQLTAPGWNRLMETHSKHGGANVEIYIMVQDARATGLALIATEPRQFTVVNIVGSIDLQKLHKLEGRFGVPALGVATSSPTPGKK